MGERHESRQCREDWGAGEEYAGQKIETQVQLTGLGGTTSMRKDQSTQMNEVSQLQHAWYHYANVINDSKCSVTSVPRIVDPCTH